MKISVYTFVDNNFDKGFYVFEMIESALTFADEVVVLDGGSMDFTWRELNKYASDDERLKIFQLPWNQRNLLKHSTMTFKNAALMQCTGDWCILQDADEVIPEWHAETIREIAETSDKDSIGFNTLHFYRDFNTINDNPDWYKGKVYMFRNFKGAHHGMWGIDNDLLVDFTGKPLIDNRVGVTVYHYGHVRPLKQYLMIKNIQHKRWHPGDEWKSYEIKGWDERFLKPFIGRHPDSMRGRMYELQG